MLKNIIFDMGGVLVNFDPQHFIERAGITDPGDQALLMNEVFRTAGWSMLDWGMHDEEDLEKIVFPQLPERLHTVAHDLIFKWNLPVEPMPGMKELMADCKAAGMKVFLLSNASHRLNTYWQNIPGSEYFDGRVISADERCVKPMPEIYRCILERYDLKAEDCMFVDDTAINAVGAINVGMRGFVFRKNADELRKAIFG